MPIKKDARRRGITLCFRKKWGTFSAIKPLFIMFGIFASLVWAVPTFAVDGVASSTQDVNVNLGASILMRILDSTATTDVTEIELNMTPTAIGTTVSDSVVVDVATSNSLGYKLYMNSDFTDGGTYTTNLVSTVGSIPSKTNLKNAWNYGTEWNETVGGIDLSGSTTNQVIPTHDSPVTLRDDVNTATNGSHTTVTFNVNADTNIPAGHYANKVVFSAVASNSVFGFNLYFNANGGTGEPEALTVSSAGSSYTFTIPDTVPTNGTLTFAGWSESPSGEATYQPGDEYTILADGVPPYSKTLYAIWSSAPLATDFWTISTMQEMTSDICAGIKTPSNVTGANVNIIALKADRSGNISGAKETLFVDNMEEYNAIVTADDQPYVAQRTLYDIRDENLYAVRKLADGNCWMVSNLALKLEADKTYTDWGSYNDGSTFDLETGKSCSTCIMNGNTAYNTTTGQGYYTWYAATAGKGTSDSTEDIDGSICPSGWRLPNYLTDSDKSYNSLTKVYLGFTGTTGNNYDATYLAVPLSIGHTGFYESSSLSYNVSRGFYWSSTPNKANLPRFFFVHVNKSGLMADRNAGYGMSIRCINI